MTGLRGWRGRVMALAVAAFLGGCQSPPFPDPNDPTVRRPNQTQVIENDLHWASAAANLRVANREITAAQAQKLVADYAKKLCDPLDVKQIAPSEAYLYGNLFLTGRQWNKAKNVLTTAVKYAHQTNNTDRLVNDTLRLSRVYAEIGDVPKAVELARSTFSVPNYQKAPILPAVLLTIVPAGKGKGHDDALAALLEGAIDQHEHTIVNPRTQAGEMFMLALPAHVRHAWAEVVSLYQASGHPDLAAAAAQKAAKDSTAGPGV